MWLYTLYICRYHTKTPYLRMTQLIKWSKKWGCRYAPKNPGNPNNPFRPLKWHFLTSQKLKMTLFETQKLKISLFRKSQKPQKWLNRQMYQKWHFRQKPASNQAWAKILTCLGIIDFWPFWDAENWNFGVSKSVNFMILGHF